MRLVLEIDGERFDVDVQRTTEGVSLECEGAKLELKGSAPHAAVELLSKDQRWRVELPSDERAIINGSTVNYFVADFAPGQAGGAASLHAKVPVRAVMHGRLVKVLTEVGKSVSKGEPLFVLEAMKMQNELASPADGKVTEVVTKPGDVVEIGRVLAWLERG